ncbi:hypothetical protein EQ826_05440 [Ectopseudomonas mendocina]|nr:hypothetical protein EQ828_08630 [Pseudomonas mendocina]TRO28224.1 hypothetical protein EQ826_05440 [Pseudomonas mendocina]
MVVASRFTVWPPSSSKRRAGATHHRRAGGLHPPYRIERSRGVKPRFFIQTSAAPCSADEESLCVKS